MPKRNNYISRDEYFMGIAILSAQRSKDPNTQVGACIVNQDNHIVGIGYNGFPCGCSDEKLPRDREGDFLDTKYPFVVHAEVNAVLNSGGRDLKNSKIYVALFPCNECAKVIIQSGVKEVIYLSDKYDGTPGNVAAKKMFQQAGIKLTKLNVTTDEIVLKFKNN